MAFLGLAVAGSVLCSCAGGGTAQAPARKETVSDCYLNVLYLLSGLDLSYYHQLSENNALRFGALALYSVSQDGVIESSRYAGAVAGWQFYFTPCSRSAAYALAEVGCWQTMLVGKDWSHSASDSVGRGGLGYSWRTQGGYVWAFEAALPLWGRTTLRLPTGDEHTVTNIYIAAKIALSF